MADWSRVAAGLRMVADGLEAADAPKAVVPPEEDAQPVSAPDAETPEEPQGQADPAATEGGDATK